LAKLNVKANLEDKDIDGPMPTADWNKSHKCSYGGWHAPKKRYKLFFAALKSGENIDSRIEAIKAEIRESSVCKITKEIRVPHAKK